MNVSTMTGMNLEGDGQNHWSYSVILALEITIGVLMNVFIVSVVLYDISKAKTISSSYKILLCLSSSNTAFGVLMSLGFIAYFFSWGIFIRMDSIHIYISLLLFCVTSCAWHTATLGFFYFIKIANSKLHFFIWIKSEISSIVPWMLCLGVLVSLLSSLSFSYYQGLPSNTTGTNPSLMNDLKQSMSEFINASIFVTIVPLLVISITTQSTVVILKKHGHRMKSVLTPDSERVKSYEKVVFRLMQSLFFYGVYYVVMVISYFTVVTKLQAGVWLSLLIFSSFTPMQAVLLVLINPRLKAAWKNIFLCVHLQEILSKSHQPN